MNVMNTHHLILTRWHSFKEHEDKEKTEINRFDRLTRCRQVLNLESIEVDLYSKWNQIAFAHSQSRPLNRIKEEQFY